jgi:exo-beta-1,3-glucanase (GH17 family)
MYGTALPRRVQHIQVQGHIKILQGIWLNHQRHGASDYQPINQYNSKGEAVTVHNIKVHNKGSRSIAPLILTLGTRCR